MAKKEKLLDEQNTICRSIDRTTTSFDDQKDIFQSSNSHLRIMLTNHAEVRKLTERCIESRRWTFQHSRKVIQEIFR